MVLVPRTTLDTKGTLAPTGKDDNKGKAKGKEKGVGKDGGGAGGGGGDDAADDGAENKPPLSSADAPASNIDVPAFWIDALEVSAADYAACIAAGACDKTPDEPGCTVGERLGDHPVSCVSVAQAISYCAFRGKRLPRMNEWTVAAGGASRRTFPWGIEQPRAERLNACGSECAASAMYAGSDGFVRTAPRGSFPAGATPEGIHDLAGNVAEWVEAGALAIVRGGSFEDVDPGSVGVLSSRTIAKDSRRAAIGFRCARDP